jgi:hypothetical protein
MPLKLTAFLMESIRNGRTKRQVHRHTLCGMIHMGLNSDKSGSSVKPGGKLCHIREQILRDRVSGLTLQFEVDTEGNSRVRLFGRLPFGNREFIFDGNGNDLGAGTCVRGLTRPGWLTDVHDTAA